MPANTFELQHPSGVCVSRGLTEAQLLSALPDVASSKTDMRTGWVWYRLPPFFEAEVVVAISLGFNAGALEIVTVADANKKYGAGWGEWSEEKEQLRASSIGSWLGSKGFTARSYSWGSVGVGYDAKGGSGSASVRFTA